MKKLMLLIFLATGVSYTVSAQGRGHKRGHYKECRDDRRYSRRDDCNDRRYYRNERRDRVYYQAPCPPRGRVVVVNAPRPPLLPPPPPFPLPLPPRPHVSGHVVINAGF
ncbi:hypothetical protein MKQ68_07340 [Chitinophaga horti]|uniref:Uncharacterized protein n=1 Tax=Chitinophaga horti TaxID=2920382 RepID=A0ABY6J5E7_9BACT|nr:hypothetical protein [Chitinophaga horti]UYQ94905.1 hypothetical protein MKQ68_07340 [Chitinophaga horti]